MNKKLYTFLIPLLTLYMVIFATVHEAEFSNQCCSPISTILHSNENQTKNMIKITLFVAPDSSYEVLKRLFEMANTSVDIIAYEMWSEDILDLINKSARRGVEVRVLLEKDPYGGSEWNLNMSAMLYKLKLEGLPIEVKLENNATRYLHAKALIVDSSVVLITSENFLPTAFPPNLTNIALQPYRTVSRGWGVVIFDANFAAECKKVFDNLYVNESIYYDPSMGAGEKPTITGYMSFSPVFEAKEVHVNNVKFVLSPSNSITLMKEALNLAKNMVLIEQMYIIESDQSVSDLINILDQKVDEGTTVQIILEDNPPGNYNSTAQSLIQRGFHVVPAFYYEPKLFLHNKGILIDDRYALVGSINWSGSALLKNIEFAALIDGTEAALYFKKVFEWDWNKSSSEPFDTDSDGLPNCYERDHGLNPYEVDSDSDGLTDYDEVFKYGTDPKTSDAVTATIENYTNVSVVPSKSIVIKWSLKNRHHVSEVLICVNGTEVQRLDPDKTNATIELNDRAWSMVEVIPKVTIPVKVFPSRVIIYVDSQPPALEILSPQNNTSVKNRNVYIRLIVIDDTSVTLTIYLNSTQVYKKSIQTNITVDIQIHLDYGLNLITIVARDAAGNEAEKLLYIYTTPGAETFLSNMLSFVIILLLLIAAIVLLRRKRSDF